MYICSFFSRKEIPYNLWRIIMRKKKFELTKGEESLMDLFWKNSKPLTSMEICELTDEFNDSYVHRLLTSLEKKKVLEISGLVKSGKQYARQFVPTLSREEYGALVMQQLGINTEKALAGVAVALVQHSSDNNFEDKETLIKELENIVKELKKE